MDPLYQEFSSLLQMLYQGVSELPGVSCAEPHGGFYIFPNFKRFGLSALDLSLRLIEQVGVVALPGTEFGPAGEGYLRLSVAAAREQVERGIDGLTRFASEHA